MDAPVEPFLTEINWLAHATEFYFHTDDDRGCFGGGVGCFRIQRGAGWKVVNDDGDVLTKRADLAPEFSATQVPSPDTRFDTKEEAFAALRQWWLANGAGEAKWC